MPIIINLLNIIRIVRKNKLDEIKLRFPSPCAGPLELVHKMQVMQPCFATLHILVQKAASSWETMNMNP